jgi:predicted secreted protein
LFEDNRSRKVVLAAHCVLNQNAKIDRCAHYPGVIREVAQLLLESGVGIVQMACPELLYLGLDRQAEPGALVTIESEDTRVARRMAEAGGLELCRGIAEDLARQVEEYRKNGFEALGVIGVNGSPTCGVETGWSEDHEEPGPGVFIRELAAALGRRGISLPAHGIKAREPAQAVAAVAALLRA